MKRRAFIAVGGGAIFGWPLAVPAQPARLPTVGVLGVGTRTNWVPWIAAFADRLRERGWTEGRTIAIEYRSAEGRSERYGEIAAEFVRLNVSVIVTAGSGVPAAKRATSTIPIVFAIAVDPVGTGMVASLAKPGGNATGISLQTGELAGKRIEILREVIPGLRRLAIIGNVDYPGSVLEIDAVRGRKASSSTCSRSGARPISRLLSRPSRAVPRPSWSAPTGWSTPTSPASTRPR